MELSLSAIIKLSFKYICHRDQYNLMEDFEDFYSSDQFFFQFYLF